jgi:CIC family chloride channel protein
VTRQSGQARAGTRLSSLFTTVLGGGLGGLVGGFVVVGVTLVLKAGMDFVSGLDRWLIVVVPVAGLAIAVLVLQVFGAEETRSDAATRAAPLDDSRGRRAWRTFPHGVARADITGDILDSAGQEERFPWRLAPIRTIAILATVGLGAAMGTEAPAAYLGVAAGAAVADRGRWWRRLTRPAALAGGAAGVSALMGLPLVGTIFMLELGHRRRAPLTLERVAAALVGGVLGWGIDVVFHLNLIRLVVPKIPPANLTQAGITALFIGSASGAITAFAGSAIYRAKKWQAGPAVRLALGGAAAIATALLLAKIAGPSAAVGPGGGAILWAENTQPLPGSLLAVSLLRAAATTAAAAAGGCGGVFVPFLAVGDLAGRVFASGLGIGADLAGAAGAAGGVSGGYRLPFTAAAVTLGVGGPPAAVLTCLATIAVAFVAGSGAEWASDKLPTGGPEKPRVAPVLEAAAAQPQS